MTAVIFWISIGACLGVAASFALVSYWRDADVASADSAATSNPQSKQRKWLMTLGVTIGVTLALGVCAVGLYSLLGRPDLVVDPVAAQFANPHESQMIGNHAEAAGGDMQAATERLANRLAQEGGSDSDWELLAQSYEMLGNMLEAERARSHRSNAANKQSSTVSATLEKAQELRRKRDYVAARQQFEQAIQSNSMTADAWADYADVIASVPGGKLADALPAIDHALTLSPQHAKALWLKASVANQQKRYADALVLWRQLRQVVLDSPTDLQMVDANIAEAQQLLGQGSKASSTTPTNTEITGEIDIDSRLRDRAKTGVTLFVFARADAGGPPLAVWRSKVERWPVAFQLNDSMAMMPGRTLSQFKHVVVQARVSQTGNAIASAGDLQTASQTVSVGDSQNLRLRIDQELASSKN